jgi:hypothetical protein
MSKQAKKATSKKATAKRAKVHAEVLPAAEPAELMPEAPANATAAEPAPPPQAKAPKAKKGKTLKAPKERKMGGLTACAQILAEAKEPMSAKAMVEKAIEKGLWKSNGKTPDATVYSAIIREIAAKGKDARFRKTAPGLFAANA